MSELAPHPGSEIKRLLKLMRINHFRLANDINESPILIQRMITGKTPLTPILAIKIAATIGLSAEALLEMQARHDISRQRSKVRTDTLPRYTICVPKPDNRSK